MKPAHRLIIAFLLALSAPGCAQGILYSHTVQPLTMNFHSTPSVQSNRQGNATHLVIPDVGDLGYGTNGIGEIAKKNGIRTIYYADIETFRILTIWGWEKVHVYGDLDQ
ncbi:MAG TPA: TRL domain-containing protein [Nitrospirota bacterium]|nr:TRL domain-containing protein [Nitrospirota bacterium]